MPAKRVLTDRQKRILAKMSLMPLTPLKQISERFDIPVRNIRNAAEHTHPREHATIARVVKHLASRPETKELLTHPKLWSYSIIERMASKHSGREIHEYLLKEAHGRVVPTRQVILDYIAVAAPRTNEEQTEIRARSRRKRVPNELTRERKNKLVEWAHQFFQRRYIRGGRGYTADEMRSMMTQLAIHDVTFVKFNSQIGEEELNARWFKYLAGAAKYYQLMGYRKMNGIIPQAANRSHLLERAPARAREELDDVQFTAPLTPRQKEFFHYYKQGLRTIEIARQMKITDSAVTALQRATTKKIRRNEKK